MLWQMKLLQRSVFCRIATAELHFSETVRISSSELIDAIWLTCRDGLQEVWFPHDTVWPFILAQLVLLHAAAAKSQREPMKAVHGCMLLLHEVGSAELVWSLHVLLFVYLFMAKWNELCDPSCRPQAHIPCQTATENKEFKQVKLL